jgi:6-pyruvoyltetrahydropterin/6-carboxytetrahydropterin synthase
MITVTRRFEFDAGHRVLGHEGKCRHLHGHRYVAEVTVTAPGLDRLNMIIDFSILKDKVGHWIETKWDHNMILNSEDPILEMGNSNWNALFGGKDPYVISHGNPTAEIMARVLYNEAHGILAPYELRVEKVRLYETPNCYAEYMET